MRQSTVGGLLVLAMLLGLCAAGAGAADDDDVPADAGKRGGTLSGFRRWFGLADPGAAKKPPAAPEKTAAQKAEATPPKTGAAPKAVDAAAKRAREENVWGRREAVCRRLLEIALETNDMELQRMAEQLDERIWTLYRQRTANLPASRVTVESDEQVLDRHLKPDSRPTASPQPLSLGGERGKGGAAGVIDRGSRAAAREDKR